MKYFTTVAFVATLAGTGLALGMAACSSGSDSAAPVDNFGGNTSTGGHAGAATAGAATAGAATGGAANGGSSGASTAGAAGASTAGAAGASTAGAGGAAGAGTAGAAGAAGAGNVEIVTCGTQMYTKSTTPVGTAPTGCTGTPAVPATKLISSFETDANGWGVYGNATFNVLTGVTPMTATPSAPAGGGANSTAKALAFKVVGLAQGIRIEVKYDPVCQDVRTFEGLSFWAKGTIDVATMPYATAQNELVITLGSEKSAQGGCTGTCLNAPDKRVTLTTTWKEYRIPFNCFGPNGTLFDGYFKDILFWANGTNSDFAIDQVGYY